MGVCVQHTAETLQAAILAGDAPISRPHWDQASCEDDCAAISYTGTATATSTATTGNPPVPPGLACGGCVLNELPYQYRVRSVTSAAPGGCTGGGCAALNGEFVLTIYGRNLANNACVWAVDVGAGLDCDGLTYGSWVVLILQDDGSHVLLFFTTGPLDYIGRFGYFKSGGDKWSCLGNNVLDATSGDISACAGMPTYAIVEPVP